MTFKNSMREQIVQQLVAILTPIAQSMGATVHRNPTLPIIQDDLPALAVFVDEEKFEPSNMVVKRALFIRIVGLARGQGETPAEAIADHLTTAANAALFSSADLSLLCGPLAQAIHEVNLEWDAEEGDGTVVSVPTRYRIEYRTPRGDITMRA